MTRPTTTVSTDAETAARLRLIISRLARAVRQHGAAGLTPSQLSALATIEEFEPIRMSDLAGYELIGAPVATRVVSSLQELGLVQKAHGSTDGRVSLIELSDAGRETLNELWNERAAGLTARIERLQPEQVAVLTAALPVLETLVRDRVS
ncbi:MAG TPA: MarR family transcriptional regulator [Acidothermaceae bacterium]|nr:MarR family transcriptional regulator [Acidothermaceae bacterium]